MNTLSDAGKTRVLILEAEGPVFTAGMDVSVFTDPNALTTDSAAARREAFMTAALSLQEAFTAFEKARFPVIGVHAGPVHWRRVDMIAGVRSALWHDRCLAAHRGDQYRHDGRCRHAAAPAQNSSRLGSRWNWPIRAKI